MPAHRIRPNHGNYGPTQHVIVDSESFDLPTAPKITARRQCLRCWTASSFQVRGPLIRARRVGEGWTKESFWDWFGKLLSHYHRTWLWSHNAIVDATWLGLWDLLESGAIIYKKGVFASPPFIFWGQWHSKEFVWVDSFNWFRCSLRELGNDQPTGKGTLPDYDATDKAWLDYCWQDTRILARQIEALVLACREHHLGVLCPTPSGQAWNSWRHINTEKLPYAHDIPSIARLERASYFGGWCDCFYQGNIEEQHLTFMEELQTKRQNGPTLRGSPVNVLDAQAFYPSQMAGREYPSKLLFCLFDTSVDKLFRYLRDYEVIATVLIETDATPYPYRGPEDTIYPRGRYWTTLASPELRAAITAGHVKDVSETAVYERLEMFTEWAEKLWALRNSYKAAADKPFERVVKTIANSLGGKMGQRDFEWIDVKDHPCRERWGQWMELGEKLGEYIMYRGIAGHTQMRQVGGEWAHACVFIASHMTSYGRMQLKDWIDICPPSTVLYSDTDSIHCLNPGRKALEMKGLVLENSFGKLHEEGVYPSAEYRNAKVYRLGEKIKAAGLPSEKKPAGDWAWTYEEWERFAQVLQHCPTEEIWTVQRTVHFERKTARRLALPDGWTVPQFVSGTEAKKYLADEDYL